MEVDGSECTVIEVSDIIKRVAISSGVSAKNL